MCLFTVHRFVLLPSLNLKKTIRIKDEYAHVLNLPKANEGVVKNFKENEAIVEDNEHGGDGEIYRETPMGTYKPASSVQSQSILPTSQAQITFNNPSGPQKTQSAETAAKPSQVIAVFNDQQKTLAQKQRGLLLMPKPQWHAPWKLYRVISGHLGWVRCVDVEPGNEWFVTGSGDRIIKIWDLASGTLKLSLTGHISAVRGVCVSQRHPYLFSCGEDKQVKCWDLEYNKVIRHYHGHLSACYCLALHPSLDVLVSAGRDNSARVIFLKFFKNSIQISVEIKPRPEKI